MKKDLLPIGSVVLLKEATKKLMIIGFLATSEEHNHKLFDYSACLYPEGLLSSDEVCLFNNEDIDTVFYKGYSSDEETNFKTNLNNNYDKIVEAINNINNEN